MQNKTEISDSQLRGSFLVEKENKNSEKKKLFLSFFAYIAGIILDMTNIIYI